MNVWIVNPFDNLPMEGNRPQRYWLMAEAFARAGHHVTLWTSDFSHATKKKRVTTEAKPSPFEVIQIPTLPYPTNVCWARLKSHRQLARDFERLASSARPSAIHCRDTPSLIIASTPPLGLCAAALRVARRCGARFVCDIQDAWPETFARLLPCGLKFLAPLLFAPMYRTARQIYREADRVTGVCRRYAKLSGRSDFYLAYHGITAPAVPNPTLPINLNLQPRPSRSRLVYIGNLGVGYDLETVIKAVAKRPDLTLDIAGKGPTEKALREQASRLGLDARVRFHGYLDAAALESLMASCDVGVIPMRDDSWVGLPYKLGDYLKAGLHVVSSLHGECGELLRQTSFGRTYNCGDVNGLLKSLERLSKAPVTLPDILRADRIYANYVEAAIR